MRKRVGRYIECIRVIIVIAIFIFLALYTANHLVMQERVDSIFAGNGTKEIPYKINSVEDLALLASSVNSGNTYADSYFVQTKDLDFKEYGNWTPIGVFDGDYCFEGVYDGCGFTINNISINGNELSNGNVGLFGKLSGTVCNLGIESGEITGACIGSIASHAGSSMAMIVNCYNKATLTGARCGGIVDNFGNGKVLCCWNEGELNGNEVGNITSYTVAEVYGCYGTGELINGNFSGKVKQSEVIEQIDIEKVNKMIKKVEYQFDLQNISLKKWDEK